jgi:BirA family biotin operon repressor/biotin-[acetyl-CoA-carboxylase] ligase
MPCALVERRFFPALGLTLPPFMAKRVSQQPPPGTTDRRIAALLNLLAENATIVVSGARIAREIGVSRSTVWRWVNRLRELGVRVKGSIFGKRIHHFFKVDSTNRVAMDLGHAGEPEGTVVIAEEQTAGRGRAGHSWHSERATGIYVTILLRPKISPVQASLLTMMAGLSAFSAIRAQNDIEADLKWPNDILIGSKKLGGILTEMHAEPNQVRFVIVGIGINVNQEKFPAELSAIATSLRVETGRPQSRLELVVRLLREFETDYNQFITKGSESVIRNFETVSRFTRGERVRVTNGPESFAGVTDGLSPEGFLRVRPEGRGEPVTVIAGDVTLDRAVVARAKKHGSESK